ncbi:MAG: helix-turn-helix domain-containing protein [Clostridia bacterium]|nr:helix-turn-helix domain-containing protein [Clostridia bacterium]
MKSLIKPNTSLKIDGFHTVYYFEFGKQFSHPPERHDSWEMVYVDKGNIIAVTDGVGCPLLQGQAIFHEPGEIHAHISDNEVANNMLVITFTCHSEAMEFFRKKTFTLDKTAKTLLSLFTDEAKAAMGKIPSEYTDRRPLDFSHEEFGASQLMESHFTELLIKLIRSGTELAGKISSNAESRTIAKNSIVELICDYMQASLDRNLSLECLCNHFFIGKSQLSAMFREKTGRSPMQYYADLKITEAKKLLREDNLSVSQITDALGYSGIHNFSRAFKKSTGFSPTEYKKSIL